MSTGRIIYEPKGAAREYAALAANFCDGICPHNCGYCYANAMWRRWHPDYADLPLTPKASVMKRFARDAAKLARQRDETGEEVPPILLSFTGDPYPVGRPDLYALTREMLEVLRDHDLHWQMLTKGGLSACEDFDLYREGDWFGTTITCSDAALQEQWEPGAASAGKRSLSVLFAHERGINTWVSCEPVIEPALILSCIRDGRTVDLWKIGKWMYNRKQAKLIDWNQFGRDLADVLTDTGARYLVKKSLARHMPDGFPLTTEED